MSLTAYLGVGALVAIMGTGLVAYHYKSAAQTAIVLRDAAIRDRDVAIAVNVENEKQVAALEASKAKADKLAAELADEIDAANNTTLALTKRLTELRAKDADVDSFLKLAVPPALRGLYADPAVSGH